MRLLFSTRATCRAYPPLVYRSAISRMDAMLDFLAFISLSSLEICSLREVTSGSSSLVSSSAADSLAVGSWDVSVSDM